MMADLVFASMMLAVPVLIGALKERSESETMHALAKVLGPVLGIYPFLYLCYIALPYIGLPVSFELSHPNWGTFILVVFGIFSYFLSLPLVFLGGWIGKGVYEQGNIGRRAADTALEILEPKFKGHATNLETRLGELLDTKVAEYMKNLDSLARQMIMGFEKLANSYMQDSESMEVLRSVAEKGQRAQAASEKTLHAFEQTAYDLNLVLDGLREDQKILEARLEALGPKEEDNVEGIEEEILTETKLTALDGRASRTTGIELQHEMARYLEDRGFTVTESNGAGQADYVMRYDGKLVAVGSNKAFTLNDEPKRMQRRISAKDVEPELVLARKLQVPMVLFVTNIRNRRRWALRVNPDELAGWEGVSTPVILSKEDEESCKRLEEDFASVIASFGVVA